MRLITTEDSKGLARPGGRHRDKLLVGRGSTAGDGNVLEPERGDGCECTECYRIGHCKMADFMLCDFHLNKLLFKKFQENSQQVTILSHNNYYNFKGVFHDYYVTMYTAYLPLF